MQLGYCRRARLRGDEGPRRRRLREGLCARAALVFCAGLVTTGVALAQPDETLLADATAPLDERLRAGAMVFVEDPDGHRRLLRVGDNGWICRLTVVPSRFTQCYEGAAQQFFMTVREGGHAVRDLRATELRLAQDGVSCAVLSLQPGPDQMRIALVVDTSGSARGALNALRVGLRGFLNTLAPQHQVSLIPSQRHWRVDYTTDRGALGRRVDGLFAYGGGHSELDELLYGEGRLDDADGWPVWVLVGRISLFGGGTRQERVRVVDALAARGVTVHALVTGRWREYFTRRTGGTLRVLATTTALPGALTELATTLGTQHEEAQNRYRVIYDCEDAATGNEVQIGVSRPNTVVRAFPDRRSGRRVE